ncbi:hypothetical protein JW887_04070 [Candidatus Dojkabacteria bacterium]|nr:hypothetical protein [Candidatus Dojkabacteria bacterium]
MTNGNVVRFLDDSDAKPVKNDSQAAVRFYPDPITITDLLTVENFYLTLIQSFIFIHNKKDASDHLIDLIKTFMGSLCEFETLQIHTIDSNAIIEQVQSQKKEANKYRIYLIDLTGAIQDIQMFCIRLSSVIKGCLHGVWIKGYISDLNPSIISLFDSLFVFDLSDKEYDILRTVISLPVDIAEQMRTTTNRIFSSNKVLFFINYRQVKNVPKFDQNPKVLKLTKGENLMSITAFMPVIVEASKFIFNEVSKWIDDIRKKASSKEVKMDLPESIKQIIANESNPAKIATLIDSAATADDIEEMESLMKQIKTTKELLLKLEEQEVLASGGEQAKIEVLIKEKARIIVAKVDRLNDLLKSVCTK